MTNWKKPWDFPVPDPYGPNFIEADFMLAYEVRSNLINAGLNFLSPKPDTQFSSPDEYKKSLIRRAINIAQGYAQRKYAPPSWDAVDAGFKVANAAIEYLKQLPVNAGDEESASVYDAWVSGKGQSYGGHDTFIPVKPAPSAPDNPLTGTIFAH